MGIDGFYSSNCISKLAFNKNYKEIAYLQEKQETHTVNYILLGVFADTEFRKYLSIMKLYNRNILLILHLNSDEFSIFRKTK